MGGSAWHVKYDGVCSRCGTPLPRGVVAVWDRRTKTIHCVECPSDEDERPVAVAEPEPIDVGVAGGSARHEYARRVAKRESDVRGRWGDRVGGWVLKLTGEPQATRAWAIGAAGEEKLAEALADVEGLRVLNDRRVRGTKGNIDHIVIAPAGVFVVDAKHYDGVIKVRDIGPFWRRDARLYVGRRDKSKLAENLGWQLEAVTNALEGAGVDPLPPITPVLCFIDGDWPPFRPPVAHAGVRLESERSIRRLLVEPGVLGPSDIDRLTRILATALPSR